MKVKDCIFRKIEETIDICFNQKTGLAPQKKIRKWELLNWVQYKIKVGELDDLIQKLPKGLILTLEGGVKNNRAIISQVTEKEYRIVSTGIDQRHPPQRIFPANAIPPPLAALIRGEEDEIYITDPLSNPLTQYMRELIVNEKINALYYTMVKSLHGIWFIIIDATNDKRTISKEERLFIHTINREIIEIEKEKKDIEEKSKTLALLIETKTISQILELQSHLFGNSQMVMGGLIKRMCQKACQNSNGSCQECEEKTKHILTHSSKIDDLLRVFSTIANDIKKSTQVNKSTFTLREIALPIQEKFPSLKINNPALKLESDKRKLEKAIHRIIRQIYQENNPPEITGQKGKIIIEQKGKDLGKLKKYSSFSFLDEEETQHNIEILELITSFLVLKKIGVELNFQKEKIEIIL